MKLFCKNSYRLKSSTRKSSIVDEQLGSKYASAVDQKANYLNEVSVTYVTMFHIKDHFVLWKKTTEHQNNGFHTWVIVILVQLRRFYRFLWCFYGFWKKFHSFYPRVHLKIQLNNFFCHFKMMLCFIRLLLLCLSIARLEEEINPFHATDLFWYPLKTSENQRCFNVYRGYQKRSVASNGL